MSLLRPWVARLLAWPSACHVCGAWPSAPLCPACVDRFAPPRQRCVRCAAPLEQELCLACATGSGNDDGPVHCHAAVDYAYPWDGLIRRFKFHGQAGWARHFGALMLREAAALEQVRSADLIAPVPLTALRLAERGLHPPWELAKAVSRAHPDPRQALCADALVRLSDGPAQHRLGRTERLRNLQGAFAVPPQRASVLAGRRVLLVDDVTTTGATLLAAARALRAVGVAQVDALVFARTPAPHESASA